MEKFKNIAFYLAIFAICLAFSIQFDKVDMDLFSRLIMGKHVVETNLPMYRDIISYTPTHIWIDHEWLSSGLIYFILNKFNFVGLTILKAILCFLTILLVSINTKDKFRIFYLTLVTMVLIHTAFFELLRCQHFSYIFYPILIYILEKQRKNPTSKIIWLIPVMTVLWLNMHAGSMYAFGIIFLYGLGEFLNNKPFKNFFIVLIPTFLAYFINPWGNKMVEFLFNAVYVDRKYIGEWQFSSQYWLFISVSIVYIYNTLRFKGGGKKFDYTKFLVLLASMIVAIRYIKFGTFFILTSFCLMYDDIKNIFEDISSFISKIIKKINLGLYFEWLIIFILFGYGIFNFIRFDISSNWYENSKNSFPLMPMQFLDDNYIEGKIFAPYFYGSFIAYKNYPKMKIYMDGRQEQVYSYDIFRKQMEFLFLKGWDTIKVLEEYEPDIILIDRMWMANEYLYKNQNYFKLAYEDDKYLIYLGPKAQKFGYYFPTEIKNYTKENLFKTTISFK